MKPTPLAPRHQVIVACLSSLPKKILALKDHETSHSLVLFELCSDRCFKLEKAAYFVDNPDFDCSRGVAGFFVQEQPKNMADIWTDPELFSQQVKRSAFYQKVRTMQHASITKNNASVIINAFARELGIAEPRTYIFPLRHDNFGVLVIEQRGFDAEDLHDFVEEGASLLGFCPLT